jgi:DNA processing protein
MLRLGPADPAFPVRLVGLRALGSSGQLWLRGEVSALRRTPVLTVVGSRAASRQAESLAESLGEAAAAAGMLVVSGGALGVDAAAHRGALAAGGVTCAVLGTGVDVSYPRRHAELYDRICASEGCLLSMFPPGTGPAAWHFPARNELMAALADVVVVVEAQDGSGSLITAQLAQRLGRRVLAFHGSPGAAHALSAGALLVRSVADVLYAVRRAISENRPEGPASADPARGLDRAADRVHLDDLEDALRTESSKEAGEPAADPAHGSPGDLLSPAAPASPTGEDLPPDELSLDPDLDEALLVVLAAADAPLDLDELCARTARPVADCAAALIGLELRGRCTRLAGGRYIGHAPLS